MSWFSDEYFCPNCRAILNDQSGFDPDEGVWTCTGCGMMLFGDEIAATQGRFENVIWFCDSCNAVLNKQSGFSDYFETWTCTECGYINNISEDEIYESKEDYYAKKVSNTISDDNGDDDSDDLYDSDSDIEDDTSYYRSPAGLDYGARLAEEAAKEKERIRREKKRAWRKKHWKAIAVCVLITIIAAIGSLGYYEYTKLVLLGLSSDELVGRDYQEVVEFFEKAGFSMVRIHEIKDLSLSEISQENKASEIKVGWIDSFEKNSRYPSNFWVTITYHSLQYISTPISSKDAKGESYADVVAQFEEAGFANIKTEILYDLITGWITDDGEVKSVSIDGNMKFEMDAKYRPDVEIVITYHTFKKNKPE